MSSDLPLFRPEARLPGKEDSYGDILLIRPISVSVATIAAAAVALSVVLFVSFGSYSRRTTVSGQLVPEGGLIRIVPSQVGIVKQRLVEEGDRLKAGQILFVVSSERRNEALGDSQEAVSESSRDRIGSLTKAIGEERRLEASELATSQERAKRLSTELTKVSELLEEVRMRESLALEQQRRYESLASQGHLSQNDLFSRQGELLDQRVRVKSLERDGIRLEGELRDVQAQIVEIPIKYFSRIAELQRSIASENQQLAINETAREWVVTAPVDGVAAAVVGELGQTVEASRPLLTIIPSNAPLTARLYAPSRAIGFVRAGEPVRLRYQAFPYQKYGQQTGTVKLVSLSALSPSELSGVSSGLGGPLQPAGNEPVYRVDVKLESQSMQVGANSQPLLAGMLVEADLLQESRSLSEWILDPLRSVQRKLE